MTQRYVEHLHRLAENGDRHAIEALRREGIEVEVESIETELPSGYDQSVPRKPLEAYTDKWAYPSWQNYRS